MNKLLFTFIIIFFALTSNAENNSTIKDRGVFFNHVASDVGLIFDGKWLYLGKKMMGVFFGGF